jgi:hypothetical protein
MKNFFTGTKKAQLYFHFKGNLRARTSVSSSSFLVFRVVLLEAALFDPALTAQAVQKSRLPLTRIRKPLINHP